MKRLIPLLLSVSLLLAACAAPQQQEKEPLPPEPTGGGAVLLSQYALAEASLPQLPAEPSHAEVEKFYEENDISVLGEEAYDAAQEAFWQEFDERSRAYYDAVKAFKGEGVDGDAAVGFYAYTERTAEQIFADHAGENVIYSPANLYLALAMLSTLTAEESQTQLLTLLGQSDTETLRADANALWRALYEDTNSGKTTLANSLWLSDKQSYHDEAVQQTAQDFFASLYAVPMGEAETDEAIAAWINANTGGLLSDAAKEVTTKEETILVLLSTLYFYDQWVDEFAKHLTEPDTFTTAAGEEQSVDFMHKTQTSAPYFRNADEGYTVAQLAFRNGAKMRFLLPDEGVKLEEVSFVEGLQTYEMALAIAQSKTGAVPHAKIAWSVPKFDAASNLDLIAALEALGVTDIFDDRLADLSPLANFDTSVCVSKVQHAARVRVDEVGCEAAAFTAIVADATAAKPEELPLVEMDLDRPFAFMITGVDGMPLFLGTVNNME